MSNEKAYTIGEFSQRTGTSKRTLHYYDEIGILRPKKHPSSGHRIYTDQDVLALQKIVSLKLLGYSLDQICTLMKESHFDLSLNETLQAHKKALNEKKEQIEAALKAINRTITLLDEEGEVDSAILMSLINNIQTEKEQRQWLSQYTSEEFIDKLFNKHEEEMVELDKKSIIFFKEVKRLVGRPVDEPEVQALIDQYMQTTLAFVGEESVHAFSDIQNIEPEQIESMFASPFSKEEDEWLQQAMEYYMLKNDMYDPNSDNKSSM